MEPATTTRRMISETVPVICAWCDKHYADKTMETAANSMLKGQPTHGICPECFIEHLSPTIVGSKVKLEGAGLIGTVQYLSLKRGEPLYHIKLDGLPQTVARERSGFEVMR